MVNLNISLREAGLIVEALTALRAQIVEGTTCQCDAGANYGRHDRSCPSTSAIEPRLRQIDELLARHQPPIAPMLLGGVDAKGVRF
jgi:hypothetical protein